MRQISRGRNVKILGARAQGAASTQDSGTRRTITRGTVLEGGNFAGKSLVGVSFQQVAAVRPSPGPALAPRTHPPAAADRTKEIATIAISRKIKIAADWPQGATRCGSTRKEGAAVVAGASGKAPNGAEQGVREGRGAPACKFSVFSFAARVSPRPPRRLV